MAVLAQTWFAAADGTKAWLRTPGAEADGRGVRGCGGRGVRGMCPDTAVGPASGGHRPVRGPLLARLRLSREPFPGSMRARCCAHARPLCEGLSREDWVLPGHAGERGGCGVEHGPVGDR
ncbi:hypothetical protein GCM10010260_35850 [Streptomyces filipinensis]|uniref:Uncharacterized protein n=1 Tax=Streptomyces filipinensis TaxID=66887 RepID=A0A918ID12_9ACTN|nr:hypothetical protein GCM10010260_35850 [Streptomyces filipinensis]